MKKLLITLLLLAEMITPLVSVSGDGPTQVVSCLGDSITEGIPYSGTENTYPARLQAILVEQVDNLSYEVINHGVSGYRADQVLAHTQDWMVQDNPDVVLLLVGGNDLAQLQTIESTVAEVQAIVDVVTAHTNPDGSRPHIIVSAILPNLISELASLWVSVYNDSLESDLTGVDLWFTDNWDDFYDPDTGMADASLMADTVHPNVEGYVVMAENWFEALSPDTDGDGLPDSWEFEHFSDNGEDPLRYDADDDPDGDGVPNLAEYYFVADPNVTDTDGDGLDDYAEIYLYHTYPTYEDTDYDGLNEEDEICTYGTNSLHPDTDHDGLNDGYEVDTSTDPLAQTSWNFSFNFDGTTHTRTLHGLSVTDDQWGDLDVMSWMELTLLDYSFPGRDIDLLETARQGIVSWAEAGATQLGIAGIAGNDGWMEDEDPITPGYQNQVVSELKAIADANDIEIVFGLKLSSILTGWEDFFAPPSHDNKFAQIGTLTEAVTEHTGSDEWILEGEGPFGWVVTAYHQGELTLSEEDINAFKANLALLPSGITIHFWQPEFYAGYEDLPAQPPQDSAEAHRYADTQMFLAIHDVLGPHFGQMDRGGWYYVTYRDREIPYPQDRLETFEALETLGAHQCQQFTFFEPYRDEGSQRSPRLCLERGPAELIEDLSYFFGRDLDNAAFPSLPFRRVLVYPGAERFDLAGWAVSDYAHNGVHFSVVPEDEITEGQMGSVILSVHREPPTPITFSVDDSEIPPDQDTPTFEVFPETQQAVFTWTPGYHRGGPDSEYYWITFTASDGAGFNMSQRIRLTVNNFGLGWWAYPNADYDGDGYSNQDERDNGTDPEDMQDYPPNDFDCDFISDLNDLDDDNDGLPDEMDPCPYTPLRHDFDCDCDVDIADIMLVANCWRSTDPECDQYDLDGNGDIDIVDIMLVAVHWGETCGGIL